ncbi:hypothetical protein PG996_014422 [Apiospora saccharicola]|uniref:Uncharacterized protein n=1 Tax=Apiospora saccharicola TaxID=335842 RepID=A0ABR1TIA0_9PEZI
MDISSGYHDTNNKTADFVVYDDQCDSATPSGPCWLCGRPSEFPSPLKEDTFECEFLCGWPVPHDIRERLRQVKKQEERRDAELRGYEADDENEDGIQDTADMMAGVIIDDDGHIEAEMDGLPSQVTSRNIADDHKGEHRPAASQDTSITSYHFGVDGGTAGSSYDTDDVDVYEEMHKTLFPSGAPWPPIPSTKPRDITDKAARHDDLQIASSGKRTKSKDSNEGSKDRPAKKQKIVGGSITTVSKDPKNWFRLGGRHNLLGNKTKPGLDDNLFGYHGDEH